VKQYISLFLLLQATLVLSQKKSVSVHSTLPFDTNYIVDYSDRITLKTFGILKSNQIGHYDNFTRRFIYYRPNETFDIGFGLVYEWLGFDIAFNFPFINNDNERFGETSKIDIQTNFYLRRFVIDLEIQKYQGYYGSNAHKYIESFDIRNSVYPIRPDMSTFNHAINAVYVFNPHKFSYRATFLYNERQIKSAGSLLAGSYLSYFKMNADSTIVPIQVRDEFNPNADFRGVTYINTGLSAGYGQTFVVKNNFFFSISLTIGLGPSILRDSQNGNIHNANNVKMAARAVVRGALGYNSEKTYFGISVISSQSSEVDLREAHLERNINNFQIFVGQRFSAPRPIKNLFQKFKL
jgi:hypothetical protein